MSAEKHQLKALTWLRGIAAFLVIVSHVLRATEQTYVEGEQTVGLVLLNLFDLGTFGVLLFFTLSGATLFISHHKAQSSPISGFYIKRIFRIWPAFAVSLLAYISFTFVFKHYYIEPKGNWIEGQFLTDFQFTDVISYLTLTFNINGEKGLFNNAYWSLPVEFQYYLIFPILILLLKYTGIIGPVIVAAICYAVFRFDVSPLADSKVLMLAFTFIGGVLVGTLYTKTSWRMPNLLAAVLVITFFVVTSLVSNGLITFSNWPIISNLWIFLGLSSISLVAIILFSNIDLPKTLSLFFYKYGEISYSVYLYHNLLIGVAVLLLIQFEVFNPYVRLGIVIFFGGVLGYYIAQLSYKYIELPSIGFGRKLNQKLAKSKLINTRDVV